MWVVQQSLRDRPVTRSERLQLDRTVLPLILLVVALALRLFRLSVQSIWWDEAYSVHLARLSVSAAIEVTGRDIHPPLYYILLHYWGLLGGFSEYSVRLLSTAFAVALVIVIYLVAREMFGEKAGLLAMAATALAPLQVLYSQEARMYTLLAFQYAVLLYLVWGLFSEKQVPAWTWLALILAEATILYTHYFAAFALVYLNLAFGIYSLTRRTWRYLLPWAVVQLVTLLLFLPWVPIAIRQTTGYVTLHPYTPGIPGLIAVTWQFLMSGLLGPADYGSVRSILAAVIGWFLLGTLSHLVLERRFRVADAFLVGAFVVPLAFVLLVWQINPAVHPRYTIVFSPPLYVLLGRCMTGLWSRRFVELATRLVLGVALLGVYANGLVNGLLNAEYAKDDVRAVARHIGSIARQDDLILVDVKDYSLSFYYHGPASIEMVDGQTYEDLQPLLEPLLTGKKRCILLHRNGAADLRGAFPFMMELGGTLVDTSELTDYHIDVYEMNRIPPALQIEPTDHDFGSFHLIGVLAESQAASGGAVCLALRWELEEKVDGDFVATVVLRDHLGRRWSQADVPILNEAIAGTSQWERWAETTNYYVLPIPLGLVPGTYSITVGLYDRATLRNLDLLGEANIPLGQALVLGDVVVAGDVKSDPYGTQEQLGFDELNISLGSSLLLRGARVRTATTMPGQKIGVLLVWELQREMAFPTEPRVYVTQGGKIIAESEQPIAPSDSGVAWLVGRRILDYRDLQIDPLAEQGSAQVFLQAESYTASLGTLSIAPLVRRTDLPPVQHPLDVRFENVAILRGYDLNATTIRGSDRLQLTLYWQANNDAPLTKSYTVFTHLLALDATLIGQHDGRPVGASRPTTGWVKDEILVDIHELDFRDPSFVGQLSLEVGLYDPQTMTRIKTDAGKDHFILPTQVTVVP